MGNTIPHEVIPDCYKYAKQAFDSKITVGDARQKIHEKLNINFGSAKDYYLYYSYLITGEKPTWGLNLFTMEYFLKEILEDENTDLEQIKNTFLYFKALINKLEGEKVGSKKGLNVIYEKYRK